jgi:class 3 adenylate cyclase
VASEQVERKLATILAADIAGYSRLMAADEEGTRARLKLWGRWVSSLVSGEDGDATLQRDYRSRRSCYV